MKIFRTLKQLRAFLKQRGFDGTSKLSIRYHGVRLMHPLWIFGHECAEIERCNEGYTVTLFKKYF